MILLMAKVSQIMVEIIQNRSKNRNPQVKTVPVKNIPVDNVIHVDAFRVNKKK